MLPINKCLEHVSAARRWRDKPLKTWFKAMTKDLLHLEINGGL